MHLSTLIWALPVELKLMHREIVEPAFSKEEWSFYTDLWNADEDTLTKMMEEILQDMEDEKYYNGRLFARAEMIAERQVQKNWVSAEALRQVIEEKSKLQFIDFEGMIAVYKIGLIKDESLIDLIVPWLLRDEDILLEILQDTLVSFQSDKVVEAVEPLVRGRYPIFQMRIIAETYTESAVTALKRLYRTIDNTDLKSVAVNGLAQMLSADGRYEIEDFMTKPYKGSVFDMDEVAYGYFKIMGYDHPDLNHWRAEAIEKIERQNQPPDMPLKFNKQTEKEPVKSKKIGRNEPCPCGSGKK